MAHAHFCAIASGHAIVANGTHFTRCAGNTGHATVSWVAGVTSITLRANITRIASLTDQAGRAELTFRAGWTGVTRMAFNAREAVRSLYTYK
jgi:hypothetical protein